MLYDIDIIAALFVSVNKVHKLQVENVECILAQYPNIPILVKEAGFVSFCVSESHLDHLLGRLAQIEILVVEEAIAALESHFLTMVVGSAFNFYLPCQIIILWLRSLIVGKFEGHPIDIYEFFILLDPSEP